MTRRQPPAGEVVAFPAGTRARNAARRGIVHEALDIAHRQGMRFVQPDALTLLQLFGDTSFEGRALITSVAAQIHASMPYIYPDGTRR